MFYPQPQLPRNNSCFNLHQQTYQQFPSPQQVFQQNVTTLEHKVSNFIQTYLKTCYNSNINAEEDLTRTTLQISVVGSPHDGQCNGSINIQPKLFIIPPHAQGQMTNLRLLQSFQLFIIKENKDNIFHYLKFLKGKADRKQCKSIKDTLTHINDFFGTFTNQIKQYVLSHNMYGYSNQQAFEYVLLNQFMNSQDFTNIQILIITRIMMKIFLIKFIRSTQGANMQDSGKNLETILQFYKTIKTELGEIEDAIKKSG